MASSAEATTAPGPRAIWAVPGRLARGTPITVALGIAVLALIAVWALLPGVAPRDPSAQDVVRGLSGPGAGSLLGTDDLGRDVLSRVIAGARTTVGGALLIAVGTVSIATALGLLAGYLGGWLDSVLSRVADVLFALPELLIAIVVVGTLGGGYMLGVAVLTVLSVPQTYRLIRAATIEQRVKPYIEACRTMGLGRARVMARHVFPNVLPMVLASLFLRFTYGTIGLASLSFLGLGSAPGEPEWGRMVADNRVYLLESPWSALAPALALMFMCVSANVVGDWLYERLSSRGVSR